MMIVRFSKKFMKTREAFSNVDKASRREVTGLISGAGSNLAMRYRPLSKAVKHTNFKKLVTASNLNQNLYYLVGERKGIRLYKSGYSSLQRDANVYMPASASRQ